MKELFSYQGRATRKNYWLSQLLFTIPYIYIMLNLQGEIYGNQALLVVSIIAAVIMYIPVLFIGIKRFHDIDKPGVYVLIGFIPYIGSLITVIMQGFLSPVNSVDGDSNQYGQDPRLVADAV